jgi:hypothetical protein
MLQSLVPNATVIYDYDYRTETNRWKEFKLAESKKPTDSPFDKIPHESGGSSWHDRLMYPSEYV